ncbi:Octaprenyl diphosphate synthase [Nymphon striatum]|nr:Octaprenyl diphosphate synthase [Nymphon striatum]
MALVNTLIRERMASEHAPRIPEVTAHLVEAGGKRLRPMLTLASARICDYDGPYHVHLAATVEFIHTATLLHDDVVDESGQRRGRPTANLLWDNKSSVLVGDYLFARSFQLMTETNNLRVLRILSNAAATIAEGEVLQMTASQDLATTEAIYLQVVRGKTAALFSAATEVGGVIAGQPDDITQALYDYGDALGIAFQIVDDLLDYQGDTKATGKNVGDDFRERKLTLPAVALADAEERAFWVKVIEKGKQDDGDLRARAGVAGQASDARGDAPRRVALVRKGQGRDGGPARNARGLDPPIGVGFCDLCGACVCICLICEPAPAGAARSGHFRDSRISVQRFKNRSDDGRDGVIARDLGHVVALGGQPLANVLWLRSVGKGVTPDALKSFSVSVQGKHLARGDSHTGIDQYQPCRGQFGRRCQHLANAAHECGVWGAQAYRHIRPQFQRICVR